MTENYTVTQGTVQAGDPHVCSDGNARNNLVYSVYEALVARDGVGFKPCLARSWAVEPDGLTWGLQLREGVRFHNGDRLKASDVVASLRRVVDPRIGGAYGTQGVYAGYIGDAEFTAPRGDTVRIRTGEPMADLLDAYPRLRRADIQAALEYAADTLAHEEVILEPRRRRTGS